MKGNSEKHICALRLTKFTTDFINFQERNSTVMPEEKGSNTPQKFVLKKNINLSAFIL